MKWTIRQNKKIIIRRRLIIVVIVIIIFHLTSQRTEAKWVQEAPSTNLTNVSNSFPRFWLWPHIQEQNSSTVYHICLYSTYVQHPLNFGHPHYIMIRRSSYLSINKQQPHTFSKTLYHVIKLRKYMCIYIGTSVFYSTHLNDSMIFVSRRTAIETEGFTIAI